LLVQIVVVGIHHRVVLYAVPEEATASIFRVEVMEAAGFSEMRQGVIIQNTTN
jgi:hypothetical protein